MPRCPPVPGLDDIEYLTNETLFSLAELPGRFGVLGSGPIGCEMAQAFARLGSEVHLFERGNQILRREDPEAATIVQAQFERDGIQLMLDAQEITVAGSESGIRICGKRSGQAFEVIVDKLLIATGRAPNVEALNLEVVDVQFDRGGVTVNDFLQTSNPNIYAAGDICSKYKFTHAADFQARIVIQNALFALGPFGKRKASKLVIPWATYTAPEIAHVGLYQRDAQEIGLEIETYVQHFNHVDRAILDGEEEGFVKVHVNKGTDTIVGATIVASNAGDLISEVSLAMTHGLGLSKIGSTIHPYPTQAEAIRKLGDQFSRTRLTPLARRVLNFLRRVNVGR